VLFSPEGGASLLENKQQEDVMKKLYLNAAAGALMAGLIAIPAYALDVSVGGSSGGGTTGSASQGSTSGSATIGGGGNVAKARVGTGGNNATDRIIIQYPPVASNSLRWNGCLS